MKSLCEVTSECVQCGRSVYVFVMYQKQQQQQQQLTPAGVRAKAAHSVIIQTFRSNDVFICFRKRWRIAHGHWRSLLALCGRPNNITV